MNIAPQILLIAYSVALAFRGKPTLQSVLLLLAFVLLLWQRRYTLFSAGREACWVLTPLLFFSLWVFAICFFWPDSSKKLWVAGETAVYQPWFSLNQWKRDIFMPMISLLCGYWAFRETDWKRRLFMAQSLLVAVLVAQCGWQYYHGEIINGQLLRGTLQVRGFSHNNIFFAYILLLLTPGAFWLVFDRTHDRKWWLRVGACILLLYLVYLNKRRGTWIAVYIELIILIAWLGRRHLCAFLVATCLLGLASYHLRPGWFVREYDVHPAYRVDSRLKINRDLTGLLLEHPWIGVGFGKDTVVKNYWPVIFQHAHNTFANLALEVGWPGLTIWLLGLGVYGRRFWNNRMVGWTERIGLALLLGFCVRNLTDDVWISSIAELFWFSIGVFLPPFAQWTPPLAVEDGRGRGRTAIDGAGGQGVYGEVSY